MIFRQINFYIGSFATIVFMDYSIDCCRDTFLLAIFKPSILITAFNG